MVQNDFKVSLYLGWNIKSSVLSMQQQQQRNKTLIPFHHTCELIFWSNQACRSIRYILNQGIKILVAIHQTSRSIKHIIYQREKVLFVINHNL